VICKLIDNLRLNCSDRRVRVGQMMDDDNAVVVGVDILRKIKIMRLI
jgi:hypothetical protein